MDADNPRQQPCPDLTDDHPRMEELPRQTDPLWLPLRDTPAYRAAYTPDACTTQELLAAVLRGPNDIRGASALLSHFRGLQAISNAGVQELTHIPGIGLAKAGSVKAALALARRLPSLDEDAPILNSPDDAAALLVPRMGHLEKEQLIVLSLNTRNRLIGEPVEVYSGSLNTSLVRVGEVFRPALQANAASVIIAHNHPSGDVSPSPEDIAVTRAFVEAGKLLDVEVLDHLVIAANRYISLKARGLGFA